MRLIIRHPAVDPLNAKAERVEAFRAFCEREIEDALSGRKMMENIWRDNLRAYEGVPKNPVRNTPIENAPNIEVTLGAIAVDAIYAQALDLIFTATPPVTARPVPGRPKDRTKGAAALQDYLNWGVENEFRLREAVEHALFDDVQLGTGVFYSPWVEGRKKTKAYTVTQRGALVMCIPIEDFIVPGGAPANLQFAPWAAIRWWLTPGQLEERAQADNWNIEKCIPVGTVGWVRSQRELLGHTWRSSKELGELYETFDIYAYFDIDGDGIEEDLFAVYDRTSRSLLTYGYNPYDTRPIEGMRYQIRGHLFCGLGVMDMIRPYQQEVTELHNHRVLNSLLANARLWKAKRGVMAEGAKIWPSKVVELDNPDTDLKEVKLSDVYPSSAAAEAITVSLAERRVGVNEMSTPRPSAVLGSRTPGITALSLMQQSNKRFTPAFDQAKEAVARSLRQCMYRYHERLRMGDPVVERHIIDVLGEEKGKALIELLSEPGFENAVSVTMTAASASINREADRQNAMLLVNILGQYYQRVMELVTIAANPQTPQPVRDVATQIAEKAGNLIEKTIRTFDQVRDPDQFVLDVEQELDSMKGLNQGGLTGLGQILTQLGMQQQGQDQQMPAGAAQ